MNTTTRKVLYSPGFGAGWTTWEHSPEVKKFMLEYQPIIEAIERGDKLTESHPAVVSFVKECETRFGRVPYLGGLHQLAVYEAHGQVRIEDYDGSESIEEPGDYQEWL